MQLAPDGFFHLTYCTNIHPAEGWDAVFANLQRFGPALKARLSPSAPFGLGLRLSAREAHELLGGARLDDFRAFLDGEGLYVAIINGFPYGHFHGAPVKADVYAPDWQDEARVRYTLELIEILSALLPPGIDGGISTAPLSYKPWIPEHTTEPRDTMTRNIARVAAALVRVKHETGQLIHLDIEPEPDCLLENADETIAFFERWLLTAGVRWLADALSVDSDAAATHLRDHVGICFDCCHFAVEYEEPVTALERLAAAGIRIGRIQLSSALVVPAHAGMGEPSAIDRLRRFADPVYLHQVVERSTRGVRHYPDLGPALRAAESEPRGDWRIHFHVPLFAAAYDRFESTQTYVQQVLGAAWRRRFTRHLEIETYTWDVLPAGLKMDLLESIAREFEWVLSAVPALPPVRD